MDEAQLQLFLNVARWRIQRSLGHITDAILISEETRLTIEESRKLLERIADKAGATRTN